MTLMVDFKITSTKIYYMLIKNSIFLFLFFIYCSNYQQVIYSFYNAINGAFPDRYWSPYSWWYQSDSEVLPFDSNTRWKYFFVVYTNKEQVQYFPNSRRVIYFWAIAADGLFCSVIVEHKLPISDIPPAQMSSLESSIE